MKSITAADLAVCENADSFLQSAMWGRFKARFGWQANAFLIDWVDHGVKPLLVLCRRIAPGITMAYIPWGPELPGGFPADATQQHAAIKELAQKLRKFLPRSTTFIRFDPPYFYADEMVPQKLPAPFKRAAADIQPPDTVLVDLTLSTDEILAGMKQKWRYNIGLAAKRGVTVQQSDEQGLEVFYQLLTETAARDGIAVHHIDYYRTLFEMCNIASIENKSPIPNTAFRIPQLRLYTATHEGDTLAAIVVLLRGAQATYLYGASANIKRELMATYALQWQAMQDAKAFGCMVYDLFGIPPNDDPAHPMAGLYRFKTGFGGKIIHRAGSWDYPYNPLLCGLFRAAESVRKKIRDRKKR